MLWSIDPNECAASDVLGEGEMDRTTFRPWVTCTVAIAVSLPISDRALAAQPVQPGLWEYKFSTEVVDTESARRRYEQLRKQWQSLSPEERRKIEGAVPKPGVPLVHAEKVCITAAQAARFGEAFSEVEEDEDCRTEYGESKGGRIAFKLTCKEQSATGVGEVVFAGPKAWSSSVRITTRPPGEQPTESVMRQESRWLSGDCGSVKPEED